MHSRLHNALRYSSETRAFLVLLLVILLRLRRKLAALRPHQMVIPATLLQIIVFVLAALSPEQFVYRFAAGNLIIVVFLMLPLVLQPARLRAHWVRPQE